MFDLLKRITGAGLSNDGSGESSEQKLHIASCVLLLEAAHIDDQCHDDEMDHLIETLKSKYDLSHEYVEELIELAHAERKNAVDLWEFTNHMNQNYSIEEKIAVMEDVWRVIHIDGQLEKHEDYFAQKVANLLRLTHKQKIDAKLKAREQLASDA
jgi:uncharacterized tellurite resistance protein B-like protein